MCITNNLSMRHALGYKQEIKRTFVLPAIAALIMGVVAFVLYFVPSLILQNAGKSVNWFTSAILLAVDVFISVIVYFIFVIKLKALNRSELLALPKGRSLAALCEKLHLL